MADDLVKVRAVFYLSTPDAEVLVCSDLSNTFWPAPCFVISTKQLLVQCILSGLSNFERQQSST